MREIKFRAWDKKQNKMFGIIEDLRWFGDGGECQQQFPHFELMQYTGLKDKNGKEIYEGDVVRWGSLGEEGTGEYYINEVSYGFGPEEEKIGTYYLKNTEMFLHNGENEIIGNIYENPELL